MFAHAPDCFHAFASENQGLWETQSLFQATQPATCSRFIPPALRRSRIIDNTVYLLHADWEKRMKTRMTLLPSSCAACLKVFYEGKQKNRVV